jgi:uncharacterized protein YkwD
MLRRVVPLLPLALVLACNGGSVGNGETGTGGGSAGDGTEYNQHCEAQADWDLQWETFEGEVLELANDYRSQGANCGGDEYPPAGPMVADNQLRCAARLHSQDMAVRSFFDHTNPDGESPWDRVDKTDYTGFASGENIAAGQPTPAEVMDAWMNSPGHCANIMNADNNELGVGFYGEGNYWTQVMGQR